MPSVFRMFATLIGSFFLCSISHSQELSPPVIGEHVSGLSPAEAVKAFRGYEGFKVTLSASEPEVRQPVAMTLDARGRVWIAEAYEYPKRAKGTKGKDRILIFEDADGDGVFDKRKVFYEGLNLVSGLEVGFGGVWVGAAPYLMWIPDRDGNDEPDGEPEILLDGFGWHDTHETLNSFIWGPDGWLYGCHGVFTHSRVGRPGTPDHERIPLNAAVWRYHPKHHVFEVFAHGTSNPWGLDFNETGHAFITACVVPHLYHVIQGGRYFRQAGEHFHPHTYDDIKTIADHLHYAGNQWERSRDGSSSSLGGGHAHCGLTIYFGDQFPPEFRGKFFFNNLHGHRINQERVEPHLSGYIGKHAPDFLLSHDMQHMGITLRYGPDGGMYLSDWYDAQTCHNNNEEIWNRTNGRIYKITYGEAKHVQVNLEESSDAELVAYQTHANEWFVRTARRVLQQRALQGILDEKSTADSLLKLYREQTEPVLKLRAIWALYGIGKLNEELKLDLLKHSQEALREWGIRLTLDQLHEAPPGDALLMQLSELSSNEFSARVRLQLAVAVQRLTLFSLKHPDEEKYREVAWDVMEKLLTQAADEQDQNLRLMYWYGICDLIPYDLNRALMTLKHAKLPTVTRFMARRLGEDPEWREALLTHVLDLKEDAKGLALVLRGLAESLANSGGATAPTDWEEAAKLFEGLKEDEARRDFELVATVFGDRRMVGKFKETIENLQASPENRLAAFENLSRMEWEGLKDGLLKLAHHAEDPLRVRWVEFLGRYSDESVIHWLASQIPQWASDVKTAGIQSLANSRPGAFQVSAMLADGDLKREEISAFVARQMRAYDNPVISERIEKHWGKIVNELATDKKQELERWERMLNPEVMKSADLKKGRLLYQGICFGCHQLFGEGLSIGPDLTGSNRGNLLYLLENLVDPNGLVGLDYQLHQVEMKDGRLFSGMKKGESEDFIKLMVIGGSEVNLRRVDIKSHQVMTQSMMPEGLLANLSRDQVRDLIGYLQSPRQIPLPVEGERVIEDHELKSLGPVPGSLQKQGMAHFKADRWSGDAHLWWTQGKKGDQLSLQFETDLEGRYEVFAVFTKAHDYGAFKIMFQDQTVIESIDLFDAKQVVTTGEVSLGTHEIKSGVQVLKVEILEPNPNATPGNMWGVDYLRLIPAKRVE